MKVKKLRMIKKVKISQKSPTTKIKNEMIVYFEYF